MVKKKVFAVLTALISMTASVPLTVSAQQSVKMVILGVDSIEAPECYVVGFYSVGSLGMNNFSVDASALNACLPEGEAPLAYGDLCSFTGEFYVTNIVGTNGMGGISEERCTVVKDGSVFDQKVTETYYVSDKSDTNTMLTLTNGTQQIEYTVDFITGSGLLGGTDCFQPDGFDWNDVDNGDKVTMLLYEGIPMLPFDLQRLGDMTRDDVVDANDAAQMLSAAAEIGAGDVAAVGFSVDVDADGALTAADAAAVLTYAAAKGSGSPLSWAQVLGTAEN